MNSARANTESPLLLKKLSFLAKSNLPGMSVQGEATEATGKTLWQSKSADKSNPILIAFEFNVPVEKLSTHLELRDQHMRERIFESPEKKLPPITFKSKSVVCKNSTLPTNCTASGELTLRNQSRLINFEFELSRDGTQFVFDGKTIIKLSDFEIPPPQHLGVKIKNEIEIIAQGTSTLHTP